MLFDLASDGHPTGYIYKKINDYNCQQPISERITFIHSNSSLSLSFMGKMTTVSRLKESQILVLPYAFIPLTTLRKKFGIYPLFCNSHLLDKSKNIKKLNHYLLGHPLNAVGIHDSYQMTRIVDCFTQSQQLHQLMIQTIVQMNINNYIRSLKKLWVLMLNMMILEPANQQKGQYYLSLLRNERKLLQKKLSPNGYFDRYLVRFEQLIGAQLLPLHANEQFRAEIANQFPIICCATSNLDTTTGAFYEKELALASIKIIFTPQKHVAALSAKLRAMGVHEQIKIYGYSDPVPSQEEVDLLSAFSAAEKIKTLNELIHKDPTLLKNNKIIEKKIHTSLYCYLQDKKKAHFLLARWLIKHADHEGLISIDRMMKTHPDFILHAHLQQKASQDQTYFLVTVAKLLSPKYLERLNNIVSLRALCQLRMRLRKSRAILNYRKEFSFQELHILLAPRMSEASVRYLRDYLYRLQDFYSILTKDAAISRHFVDNIAQRLAFVQHKYEELLIQLEKESQLDELITKNDLYLKLKTSVSARKKWFVFLGFVSHATKLGRNRRLFK